MFFKQFHLEALGHASYLIGSDRTGEALVVDPRRDVDAYFTAARDRGLRISHAVDTHGHNDYLSGITEVAARGDVEVLASAEGRYGYEHRPVFDGEVVQLGELAVQFIHTPGHTPEHLSLLLHDRSAGDEPAILLSGGALLVGDLARPDLLGGPEEAKQAAKVFCCMIQEKLLRLPDYIEVFPTHVAGSLCGGNIGSRLSTTLGYEKRTNPILSRVASSDHFVDECLRIDNLPAVPPYWRRMRRQNLDGPPLVGLLAEPPALPPADIEKRQAGGAVVLDCRDAGAFAGGHIPGALNVGLGTAFPTWAGTVLPTDADVLVVLDAPSDLPEVVWHLLRIGYRPPAGWLAGGMMAWRTSGRPVDVLRQMTVAELHGARERGDLSVLDVRQPAEWAAGRVPGAVFITGAELPARLDDVPDGPVAVVCGSGFRSSVAASLLAHHGRGDVVNVVGGMSAWNASGFPTEG